MYKLIEAFNPMALEGVMCKNTISIDWTGQLFDCDFNQMLNLKLKGAVVHIKDFDEALLNKRNIQISQHCYGCTAGAGSSCQGSVTN